MSRGGIANAGGTLSAVAATTTLFYGPNVGLTDLRVVRHSNGTATDEDIWGAARARCRGDGLPHCDQVTDDVTALGAAAEGDHPT